MAIMKIRIHNSVSNTRQLTIKIFLMFLFAIPILSCKDVKLEDEVKSKMFKATKYFVENLSVEGGYVWYYATDLSRSWGELEAYPSMVWVQGPGTVAMGNIFLDAFEATKDEYYYKQAERTAYALIKGQLECGGWNYLIDFNGEDSLIKWYDTIGKSAWRLEEFHHYYGNSTFDDGSIYGPASFLLKLYLYKHNPEIKAALDKAIDFILVSQYPNGAWPQRFPEKPEFNKEGNPDYTGFYTFNDGVIWDNLCLLITCYVTLEDDRFLEPIHRSMNFYLQSLQPNPQVGWSLQYSIDLKPAGARTYEPKSLDPQLSLRNVESLMLFYQLTGEKKYFKRIPEVFAWIESVKFSSSEEGMFYSVPKFVEIGTNKPLFTHRRGENSKFGKYYFNYENKNNLIHYSSVRRINFQRTLDQYRKISERNFPNKTQGLMIPESISKLPRYERLEKISKFLTGRGEENNSRRITDFHAIAKIMNDLDKEGRWLTNRAFISNPYIGEPVYGDAYTEKYAVTYVGNKYDTSPFPQTSDTKYISTSVYIENMTLLMNYLKHNAE